MSVEELKEAIEKLTTIVEMLTDRVKELEETKADKSSIPKIPIHSRRIG